MGVDPKAKASEALVLKFNDEIWNHGNVKALPKFLAPQLLRPAATCYAGDPIVFERGLPPGGYAALVRLYRTAFPDLHVKVESISAKPRGVTARWLLTGTHKGQLAGVQATGKKVAIEISAFYRIERGKITNMGATWDINELKQQLGVPLQDPSLAANQEVVAAFIDDVWNKGNVDVLEKYLAGNVLADQAGSDCGRVDPLIVRRELQGLPYPELVRMYRTAFPDLQVRLVSTQIHPGGVSATWVATGTHQGDLAGTAPTGKSVRVEGNAFYRLDGGKITGMGALWDVGELLDQLGAPA